MSKSCCEVWPKICGVFVYFRRADGEEPGVLMMPHVNDGESKWRVNYCPACGADIRGRDFSAGEVSESVFNLTIAGHL